MRPPPIYASRSPLYAFPVPSPLAQHWSLDPSVTFLNHGSFGATPIAVLEAQAEYRARLEREPVRFYVEELEGLLDTARASVASFLHAPPDTIAFVPNATVGVNAVLRSLEPTLRPGDELLTTSQAYNACANALRYTAGRTGARVVVAELPIPLSSEDEAFERILAAATERTRLALIDHVTSPTAAVLPLKRIVRALDDRAIDTLVDGAHAPAMLDLSLSDINAAYYTGNFHKWLCAPKGAGFLYVRPDRQEGMHPAVISHGLNSPRTDRSRFLIEFDWTGTADPTPFLCAPHAIKHVASLVPGGWPAIRERNNALARHARTMLIDRLDLVPTAPESMVAHIASVILPAPSPHERSDTPPKSPLYADPLQHRLLDEYRIQVPIIPWPPSTPSPSHRLTRVSAQLYNDSSDYERYADALQALLQIPPPPRSIAPSLSSPQ